MPHPGPLLPSPVLVIVDQSRGKGNDLSSEDAGRPRCLAVEAVIQLGPIQR
jgi:hypothetical protein